MPAPALFDHAARQLRLARAARLAQTDTVLLPRLAEEMAERMTGVLRDFPLAVDFGSPGADIAAALRTVPRIGRVLRAGTDGSADLVASEWALPFASESLDLVVSALSLQWADDLPGVLVQIRRALRPDGLFLAAVPGSNTLAELREALAQAESEVTGGVSPRVIPLPDTRDLGGLLQRAGFALPVVDADRITVRYGSLAGLFQDLRALGATNVLLSRSRSGLRRDVLARLDEIYAERFADPDGRLRVTVEIVWMSGWAPHESQQPPLRPGSAKARLADALGTVELPSGVKPGG